MASRNSALGSGALGVVGLDELEVRHGEGRGLLPLERAELLRRREPELAQSLDLDGRVGGGLVGRREGGGHRSLGQFPAVRVGEVRVIHAGRVGRRFLEGRILRDDAEEVAPIVALDRAEGLGRLGREGGRVARDVGREEDGEGGAVA
jgi:hypothetical protein